MPVPGTPAQPEDASTKPHLRQRPVWPDGDALLGLAETAELLAISKAALCERRRRAKDGSKRKPGLPEPVALLRCGPIWRRSQIEEYRRQEVVP